MHSPANVRVEEVQEIFRDRCGIAHGLLSPIELTKTLTPPLLYLLLNSLPDV